MAAETHDYLWDNPVREIEGKEIQGFLLARQGSNFYAHYVDAVIEAINPPEGFPRPDPDPADRTKRVVVPVSFRGTNPLLHKHGSRYTGQMRRVVQCQYSRGIESRFKYGWPTTHGILEYPYPRQIGSTAGEESIEFSKRRFWIVEISSAGVYAAPVTFGLKCMSCAAHLSDYAQPGSDVDLAWAFVNKNESGKVLRLLDAAGIAQAYAYGSPWYAGMGWAFSWSGRAASNVVQRKRTLPDHYETRLIDLDFTVTPTPTSCSIELLPLDHSTARVTQPGHGIGNGQAFTISGAEQAAYNGTHIAKDVTATTFDFAIAGDPFTPATGDIKVTSSLGPVTITAELTIGSPGRVTFRPNDLGTLWVPGELFFGEWDGIPPFSNIVNSSGPVHVFYDGEEKIVTTWSMSFSQIPAESHGAVHMASVGPAPGILWIGPIDQVDPGSVQTPGHECQVQGRETIYEDGHSYGAYTNIAWGFSGSVDLQVNGFSRSRINTTTGPDGGLFHEAAYDWGNGGGFSCCGGVGSAVAFFNWETWSQKVRYETITSAQSASGTSALVLLPADREAVAGIRKQREFHHDSHSVRHALLRANEWRVRVTPIVNNGCVGTPIPHWPRVGSYYEQGGDPIFETTSETFSSSFSLRASGGVSYSGALSTTLDNFSVYVPGTKETADSSLFFMRGGLEYADPGLAPNLQKGNRVLFDGNSANYLLSGGFAALPAGRAPVAFIGQV